MDDPVYLHVRLKVDAEQISDFYDVMARAVPIIEELGWKFIGAWVEGVGRLNTVIDLWELKDANAYYDVMQEFSRHPEYPEIVAVMNRTIEEEIVTMMRKVPYGRR